MKRSISIIILICILTMSLTSCGVALDVFKAITNIADTLIVTDEEKYNNAIKLIEENRYNEAYDILKGIEGYAPAEKALKSFYFVPAKLNKYDPEKEHSLISYDIEYDEKDFITEFILRDYGRETSTKYKYDDAGNMIFSDTSVNAIADATVTNTFDSDGRLLLSTTTHPDGKTKTEQYFYDKDGKLIKHTLTDYDQAVHTTTYSYNLDGVLKEEIGQDRVLRRTFDSSGNIKTELVGVLNSHYYFEYTITSYTYDEAGKITTRSVNKSDGHGNIISFVESSKYTYDVCGKLVKETLKQEAPYGTTTKVYTYNEKGQCVELNIEYPKSAEIIKYFYDEYGCITRVEYEGTTTKYVIEIDWKLVYFEKGLPRQAYDIIELFENEIPGYLKK